MIRVIDDAFTREQFARVSNHVRGLVFKPGWKSRKDADTSHSNTVLSSTGASGNRKDIARSLAVHPSVNEIWAALVNRYLPGAALLRAYSNHMVYGQDGAPHADSPREQDYTALIYLNEVWKPLWAGETCFFDASGDTERAVLPKPNRLVIFPSRVLHAARGVYPTTPDPRLVLVFKTTFSPER